MKKVLLTFSCVMLFGLSTVLAQTRTITGTVTASDNGTPVPGATVFVKGTTIGSVSQADGRYSVNVPQDAEFLVVSFIGMRTQEVEIAGRSVINVILHTETQTVDEVMVVAYGTARKSSFTGSATVVDTKKLEKRTVSNITKALDGQVPGVVSSSGGGQPGDGANIRVRGYGSINASQAPLYVVDGVPFDGSLNSINPSDIESITVLKDASSGALYGSRGANGVVIITTKRGKAGETDVNFKATYGWASRGIKPYDMVDQKEFVQLSYEAIRNGYIYNNNYSWDDAKNQAISEMNRYFGGEIYNPFKNYTWATIIDPATEQLRPDAASVWDESWIDAIYNKNAPRQDYQFSVTGGSEKTQHSISFGYLNEEGILTNTGFERISARGSIDSQAKVWLKTGLSANLAKTKQNYSHYTSSENSNVWYSAQFMAPIYPVYVKDVNGNDLLNSLGEKEFDYGTTRPAMNNFNSIATLYDDKSDRNDDNVSAKGYVTFGSDEDIAGVLKGLKLTLNMSADLRNQSAMYYYNMFHGNFSSRGGMLQKYATRIFSTTANQLLTYSKKINQHSINVLAGHESYMYQYNELYGTKSGLVEGIYELAPAVTVDGTGSYQQDYKIESYLGRINYNYREKYYADASFRTDGSSRFHRDHRWGNFWSAGANWRISEESFIKNNVSWINNLSLKASYGLQGNDNILDARGYPSYYLWQSFYNLTWPNASQGGARVVSLENREITWEKNYNLNTGIEARLFNNRLDLSFEYFNRQTKDMLLFHPMALSTGFLGYNENIGDMQNTGFDASISGMVVDHSSLKWRLTFTASKLYNKVLALTDGATSIVDPGSQNRVIEVGKEISTWYISKSAGVDPATGAQLYWVYDKDENGNITNEYVSSDYSKAATSKYYLGSRIPKLYGGISTDLSFKGIDFAVLTTYSLGGKIYESVYSGAMNIMYDANTWHKNQMRRWQKQGDITDVPRVERNPSYVANDRFLIDASYFAIKNITLGYTLPQRWLDKVDIGSLRVFCVLDNFMMFSHLDGMDPQYNFTGGSGYAYTPSRNISVGVDIHF